MYFDSLAVLLTLNILIAVVVDGYMLTVFLKFKIHDEDDIFAEILAIIVTILLFFNASIVYKYDKICSSSEGKEYQSRILTEQYNTRIEKLNNEVEK